MSKNGILCLLFFALLSSIPSCLVVENQFTGLAPGIWRGVLEIEPKFITENPKGQPLPEKMNIQFEEVADGELPFQFEVIYENENDFYINVINGEERIKVDNSDIKVGIDRKTGKDTVWIDFPIYESYIKGIFEGGLIDGQWVVKNRKNYSIPFKGHHSEDYRFTNLRKKPKLDMTGKWEVYFGDGEDTDAAIGEFVQKGNELTGTFLTETGDYRFLEGTVQDNKFYLSCFDGSHAFLFEGKIKEDESLIGTFRSGKHYKTTWTGKRNPDIKLTDPNELTFIKDGYDSIEFSFPNEKGQMVSLKDDRYKNKAKIVQILGTWCPNCRDETNFLVDYLQKNPNKNIEVIALAFEKYREPEKAKNAIQIYKNKFKMPYEMLLAGYSNKKEAAESLPMLNHILSYPTMIFLDKNDKVRKIHTGFAGPATSQYEPFKQEFEAFVAELVAE